MRPRFVLSVRALGLLLFLLAGACAAAPPQRFQIGRNDCPIIASSDWAASINAMPGPNAPPTLTATGKVTVPTGGYHVQWAGLVVLESYPAQVVAYLDVIPPAGLVTRAVVTHDVRGRWPVTPPVRSFTVRCGEHELARVAPVETAH